MAAFEEITLTLPDGYRAYGRYFAPTSLCGAVLYHHGIQSHCGWYEHSARRLRDAGFAVLQMDRRGSGKNMEQRGHAESAQQLVADAQTARNELLRRTGLPEYHVVGVSWGGRLAVSAYVDEPGGVKSLSLVTPGLFPLVGVDKDTAAEIGYAMIYEQERYFEIPLSRAELFCQNQSWQGWFDSDDLTLREATAGFYLASRRMDKIIAKLGACPEVPLHLFTAGDERIVDNAKTVEFIRNLGWENCKFSNYPGLRHQLEVEGDAEIYYRDLVTSVEGAGRHHRS